MPRYIPTPKAFAEGHKLTRVSEYVLSAEGGLTYPDGAGGMIAVPAAGVAAFLHDGWLMLADEPVPSPSALEALARRVPRHRVERGGGP